MKKVCVVFLAALFLCACEGEIAESGVSQSVSSAEVSEETAVSCVHEFGDEPVEIVGNLYVYECSLCGEREVVPQGTLIGGEE